MTIRLQNMARGAALPLLLLLAVAGCDDKKKDPPTPPPVVVVPPAEDAFGTGFGTAFRASPNSDPRTPADGDIVPLTLTQDAKSVG